MATFNWPGFGIASVSWTFDQPAQVNRSSYTAVRAVASNPWHGKWSAKVQLSTKQGDGAFQATRAFFTGLLGTINNFHLPAVEAPQNANTGVTLNANAAQGANNFQLLGVTTALVPGNMVTIAGQLLSLTTVAGLDVSTHTQTVSFMPTLRVAALSGASVETAKPYALVALTDSSFSWDIAQWRQYGLSFTVDEDVGGTDGASPSGDTWNATFSSSGTTSGPILLGVAVENNGGTASQVTTLNFTGDTVSISGSTATIPVGSGASDYVNPVTDYGVVAGTGHGAANDAAMLTMFADLRTKATNVSSTYQGTIPIHFPAGYFEFSSTIDLTDGTFRVEGAGCDFGITGAPATLLKFPTGVTGIRVQRSNTSGASGTRTAAKGADGSVIRRLTLKGAYSSTETTAYGIHLRANALIEEVSILNFEGDGIYSIATAGGGGASEGNANNTRIVNSAVVGCRNGIFIDGADTNIWAGFSLYLAANRQWGLWDSSFLGNNHFSYQADSNGLVSGSTPSVVSYSSNRYCVKFGQETGASTNAPSGTTADNTWWYYMGAGGVSSGNNINAWTSGTTYRSGGSFLLEGSGNANNVLCGCYHEGGSGLAQNVTQPTLVIGGNVAGVIKGACYLGADNGGNLKAFGPLNVTGNFVGFGAANTLGPQSGSAADNLLTLYNTNVSSQINFQRFGSAVDGYILSTVNALYVNGANALNLRVGGVNVAVLGSTGMTFQSGYNPTLTEIAAASVTAPAAGSQTLFIDTADHKLKRKDSGGTVTIIA